MGRAVARGVPLSAQGGLPTGSREPGREDLRAQRERRGTALSRRRSRAARGRTVTSRPSWRLLPWALLLLVLPFREGSGAADGLLVAQLVFLVAMGVSARPLARADRRLAGAAGGFLAVAALAGGLGGYRFGSLLAVVDLAGVLGALVATDALARQDEWAATALPCVVAPAGVWQAIAILGAWVVNGFGARTPGTLLNPDHAAAYLLLAFWAAIAATPSRASSRRRVMGLVLGGAAALLLAASILQASRGALIALIVGGGVFLVLRAAAMSPRVRTA